MIAGISPRRILRLFNLALPAVFLLGLAGCDTTGEYPADLQYTLRTDPLINTSGTKAGTYLVDVSYPPGALLRDLEKANDHGAVVQEPRTIPEKLRQELNKQLGRGFGTPAHPRVRYFGDSSEDASVINAALPLLFLLQADPEAGDPREALEKELAEGSKLYRRHCLYCHGLTGDGKGPTGPYVNPFPRDYRLGVFKYISTDRAQNARPRRDDLHRTLMRGIEGTSMPSFALLKPSEIDHLISYVIHLSIRGEVEFRLMKEMLDNLESPPEAGEIVEKVFAEQKKSVESWNESNKADPKKPQTPPSLFNGENEKERYAAIERGYKLFTDPKELKCADCHLDFGRQAPFRFDEWGTLVKPRNLTAGIYGGGRRPIDFYWRMRNGIPPSKMPNVPATLTDAQIWDLVAFIQALPYREMLPEKLRDQIYDPRTLQAGAASAHGGHGDK